MLDNALKSTVDRAWDGVWSSGVTNPIVVSDLLGSLLMVSGIDGAASWKALAVAARTSNSTAIAGHFAQVRGAHGIDAGSEIESEGFWRDSRVLVRAMDAMEPVARASGDVLGDIYEHILSKLSLAGHFGQFRTPRHIVELMVQLVDPQDGEKVLDPACGSGGFLVEASSYRHLRGRVGTFEGVEIDRTVARLAAANTVLHSMGDGVIGQGDGLRLSTTPADVILANPPFAGSVGSDVAATFASGATKTELLFVEAIGRALVDRGRAAVIVPTSVLVGANASAKWIRKSLVLENNLISVTELPSGVFRPYTDVKTAILFWRAEPPSGTTLMLRVVNDGLSLDQRRVPIGDNDLPDVLAAHRGEPVSIPTAHVTSAELAATGFNLSPSRYLASTPVAPDIDVSTVGVGESIELLRVSVERMNRSLREMEELAR